MKVKITPSYITLAMVVALVVSLPYVSASPFNVTIIKDGTNKTIVIGSSHSLIPVPTVPVIVTKNSDAGNGSAKVDNVNAKTSAQVKKNDSASTNTGRKQPGKVAKHSRERQITGSDNEEREDDSLDSLIKWLLDMLRKIISAFFSAVKGFVGFFSELF